MLFYLLALVVNLVVLAHAVANDHGLLLSAIEVGTTAGLSIGFVYVGYKIPRAEFSTMGAARVLLGVLVFGTIAMVVASILVGSRVLGGTVVEDEALGVFLAWTWGASFGAPLSFYHEQMHRQKQKLAASIEEAKRLSRQLAINQRIMRHNLRNDLNVIMGFTERLRTLGPSSEQRGVIDAIEEAAQRLHSTSETFLTIQRVLENDTNRIEFDLTSVVHGICEGSAIADSPVTIDLALPDSETVVAHRLLPDAIRELISNAIRHNDATHLTVAITLERLPPPASRTRLVISDTGTGLPPEAKNAIEGQPETPVNHPGGVGLWFVRTVIKQSGGSIQAATPSSGGTQFLIDLPTPTL